MSVGGVTNAFGVSETPPGSFMTLTSDFSVANSVTLTNVPGLAATLVPGNYQITIGLNFNTNAAAIGYKWGFNTVGLPTYGNTGAFTGIALVAGAPALFNGSFVTGLGNTQAAVTTANDLVSVTVMVTVTATGVLQLQFAQGTSSATNSTLSKGSSLAVVRLA